jgi:type III secretion protein T
MTGWVEQLLMLGLATTRIAVAFLMLPLFANDVVPPLVRNSILVAFGLITLVLLPDIAVSGLGPAQWVALFAKEIFVGLAIGFFFGAMLWAVESAGQIIDTKVGATMAQVVDPISGHQTSLTGAFLGRLANFVFLGAGGLTLLIGSVFTSYGLWPIGHEWPRLPAASLQMFESEFGRLMALAALVAAPVLTILFLIDLGLGLVNRFAQQLNVFALSMSIKAAASVLLLILLLPGLVEAIRLDIAQRPALVEKLLADWAGR